MRKERAEREEEERRMNTNLHNKLVLATAKCNFIVHTWVYWTKFYGHIYTIAMKDNTYSGTPLKQTPFGPKILSTVARCP